jgi:hypothetical protein
LCSRDEVISVVKTVKRRSISKNKKSYCIDTKQSKIHVLRR